MTPLEAAARAITAKDEWGADQIGCGAGNSDCRNGHCLECSRLVVRAALSAAIEALPELLEIDAFQDRHGHNVHMATDVTHVFVSRIKVARGSWLRRAFGVGDQEP